MATLTGPVLVVDYDDSWPQRFDELRSRVAAALGNLVVAIEHVGSTAVPGMAAKPIIDMDALIASSGQLPAVVRRLAGIGYVHQGDLGIAGREAFQQPADLPPHHLYVCVNGNEEHRWHIAFREYLRNRPDEAHRYSQVKREAARRFANDRTAYAEAKQGVVEDLLSRALHGR